jgi:hypothetical protein
MTEDDQLDSIGELIDRKGHERGRPTGASPPSTSAALPGTPRGTIVKARLTNAGAEVLLVQNDVPAEFAASSEGFLLDIINFGYADYESRQIGATWKRVHSRRVAEGKYIGGPPLGYRSDKELGLTPTPPSGPCSSPCSRATPLATPCCPSLAWSAT